MSLFQQCRYNLNIDDPDKTRSGCLISYEREKRPSMTETQIGDHPPLVDHFVGAPLQLICDTQRTLQSLEAYRTKNRNKPE